MLLLFSVPVAAGTSADCECYMRGVKGLNAGICSIQKDQDAPATAYNDGVIERRNGDNEQRKWCGDGSIGDTGDGSQDK